MVEDTYEDIIMDPEDPRLEGAIDKECYFSDYPKKVLDSARNNSSDYLDCLISISKERVCPFYDKYGNGWTLIIIKKEEPKPKPKYVPFENVTEFLDAYRSAPGCLNEEAFYLSKNGIWLKQKEPKAYVMATEIYNNGVVIGSNMSETPWGELLNEYTFLDGSPCGKEVKE